MAGPCEVLGLSRENKGESVNVESMSRDGGWQLPEDGPEAYEKYIVPAFSGAWAADIVERANLSPGSSVLDLGCGTGIVSRSAYTSMGGDVRITGVDINDVVLKKAIEISGENGSAIKWQRGAADSLPFADAEFDVAVCQQGLQYFPDRPRALTEVHRVLAPKGRGIFSVWRPLAYSPFYHALHRALGQYVNNEAASTLFSAYTLGDAEELRQLFVSAGFNTVEISIVIKQMHYPDLSDFLFGGVSASPFATDIFQLKASKRREMYQSIYGAVSEYMDDHGLAAPMESYIVSAAK